MEKSSRPRILFVVTHAGLFRRFFDRTISHLLDAGYDITLVLCKKHKTIGIEEHPLVREKRITVITAGFTTPTEILTNNKQRVYRDILFYAHEKFRDATNLKNRFVLHQKKGYITPRQFGTWLRFFEGRSRGIRKLIDYCFSIFERMVKPHEIATSIIDQTQPDLVIVSPLVQFFSNEVEFVKDARRRGIPTVFPVASWDNLTNKGVVKVKTDLVAVWNKTMADEARLFHAIPAKKIVVTGATAFDWWYDEGDIWGRDTFFRQVKQPYVKSSDDAATLLYLCSSASIASGSEVQLVEKWVKAVRNSADPRIQQARIIVRMHPMNTRPWQKKIAVQQEMAPEDRRYTIYPTDVSHPTNAEQQACFLNSIYHADAIIGLNTSAMIEAVIMGKPVLTFKGHAKEDAQTKNMHFHHLVDSGCVRISDNLLSHVKDLEEVLGDSETVEVACRDFAENFVRPRGLELEAAKCLADEIDSFFKSRYSR